MAIEIRPVAKHEQDAAWRVLVQLRPQLTREEFATALTQQGTTHGYELIGAFEAGRLLGVLGMRTVHTFARARHLHIDDLIVDEPARGRGVGGKLLSYAEALARQRALGQVFLDSRAGAVGFYERLGYRRHQSVLVKKRLDDDSTPP